MPKHLYLIFIATFIFGLVSGSVLFLYNNTGGDGDGGITGSSGMSITAHTYGGCEYTGCSSYRIEEGGAYTYIVHNPSGEERRYEDSLTNTEWRSVSAKLSGTDLPQVQSSEFTGTCPAYVDGISYRYEVVYKNVSYEFDSCEQATEDVPLFETLRRYFEIFNLTHSA